MSGFGPRTYLIGQILPLLLPGIGTINSRAEDLDEVADLYPGTGIMGRVAAEVTA